MRQRILFLMLIAVLVLFLSACISTVTVDTATNTVTADLPIYLQGADGNPIFVWMAPVDFGQMFEQNAFPFAWPSGRPRACTPTFPVYHCGKPSELREAGY